MIPRAEHKALLAKGDKTLKGQRMLFLFNPENFSEEQAASFDILVKSNLKAGQSWAFKELFANFRDQPDKECAHIIIKKWGSRVKKQGSTLSKNLPQCLSVISMGYSTTSLAV